MIRTALVPGTFDPLTSGHLDIIERSSQLFDHIVVGVAESPRKGSGTLFTLEERRELAEEACVGLPNVEVRSFTNLLVDFAHEVGATAIVKGLRVVTDFESEFQQAALNYRLSPDLETLFIMSNPEHMYLSSSIVREVAQLKGNVSGFVPPCVARALSEKFGCSYE
jgi:pantetheine-phosphate adenylyltransferase